MKSAWIEKILTYDGTQLRSGWIAEHTRMQGDSIAAFVGPADVPIENMVDLEDVANNAPIFSQSMLHFLVEHTDADLELMVARQRLLVAIATDLLRTRGVGNIERRGDDIFDADNKLSVSIATSSPVSSLIHFALNIESEGTPVPTEGLADYGIDPKPFGEELMRSYCEEVESMNHAKQKVRPVP